MTLPAIGTSKSCREPPTALTILVDAISFSGQGEACFNIATAFKLAIGQTSLPTSEIVGTTLTPVDVLGAVAKFIVARVMFALLAINDDSLKVFLGRP